MRLLACALMLPLVVTGCMTEQRVISDNSVTAQFSALNGRNGWAVADATTDKARAQAAAARAKARKNQPVPVANNNASFLGDVHWTTNLKIDDPAVPQATHPTPTAGAAGAGYIPGMGAPPSGNQPPANTASIPDSTLAPGPAPAMMQPDAPPVGPSIPGMDPGYTSSPGPLPGR